MKTVVLEPDPGSHPGRALARLAWLIAAAHVALAWAVLFPSLSQIAAWDEAVYVNLGREMLGGHLPNLSMNPLAAAVYAVAYLPFQASAQWLAETCSLGRVLCVVALWIATYQVARELRGRAHPLVLMAAVAASPVLAALLDNGTNALFAAMSGLALSQLLGFERTGRTAYLWRTSLFVGLAALSRNEGPVLFAIFLALAAAVAVRHRIGIRALPAALVPVVILIGGYVGLRGLITGDWALGTRERSYFTFEQGHGMAFAETYGNKQAYVEGEAAARQLFGTPEENHHSILTAIRRNPSGYAQRIPRLARSAARDAFVGYGGYFGLVLLVFAARGVVGLVRQRAFLPLFILGAWGSYAVLYVLLCYQPHHLLMPYLPFFALAAVGVTSFVNNLGSRTERHYWTGGLVAVALLAGIFMKLSSTLVPAALLLLLGLWAAWLVHDLCRGEQPTAALAGLILFATSFFLKAGPTFRPSLPGGDPDERASRFLVSTFSPQTRIAAWAPGMIWSARMEPVLIGPKLRSLRTADEFAAWMEEERLAAIYLDDDLRRYEAEVCAVIASGIGQQFQVAFDSGNGVQIVRPHDRGAPEQGT